MSDEHPVCRRPLSESLSKLIDKDKVSDELPFASDHCLLDLEVQEEAGVSRAFGRRRPLSESLSKFTEKQVSHDLLSKLMEKVSHELPLVSERCWPDLDLHEEACV